MQKQAYVRRACCGWLTSLRVNGAAGVQSPNRCAGRKGRLETAPQPKRNPGIIAGVKSNGEIGSDALFFAIVADCFNGAAFERLHALSDFLFRGRLLLHERIATFIMARKE